MRMPKSVVRITLITAILLLTPNLYSQDPNFHIYICFGQSNMEGQGAILSQDRTVDSRFQVMQALNCSNLGRTKAAWYKAVPPLCQCYSGLSPADYFGRSMVENLPDSIKIGIINVSVAGCDIRLFDKDIYQGYDSTYNESWFTNKVKDYGWNPYQHLMDLAHLAQQDGVIKGILLHQGETNTGNAQWPSFVKKIYNDMLTELSLVADSVPLLAGEVLSASGSCCSSMNTIINKLPASIPTSHVISSKSCKGMDNAHFDSEGYRILGRRYAVKMLSLMGYEAVYSEAECGTVGESLRILADVKASNGTYAAAIPGIDNISEPPADDLGAVKMNVSLSRDTSYYVFGRFNNPDVNPDSIWIKIDDKEYELVEITSTTGWQWSELISYDLIAGKHIITIALGKGEVWLDKIAVKNSPIAPVGPGEEANNICVPKLYTSLMDEPFDQKGYTLEQNFPNPFAGITSISFEVPNTIFVSLKVFDIKGEEVAEFAGKEFSSGKHTVDISLDKQVAGSYLYTFRTDQFSETRKMILQTD